MKNRIEDTNFYYEKNGERIIVFIKKTAQGQVISAGTYNYVTKTWTNHRNKILVPKKIQNKIERMCELRYT